MRTNRVMTRIGLVTALGTLLFLATVSDVSARDTLRKTLKGAAAGALIGAVVDGSDGAAKGAAIGGGAGLIAGALDDDDRRRRNRHHDRYDNQGDKYKKCKKKKNRDKPFCRRR